MVAPTEGSLEWDILEVKRLLDHQDNILSLANVNGKLTVYISVLCKILYMLTAYYEPQSGFVLGFLELLLK